MHGYGAAGWVFAILLLAGADPAIAQTAAIDWEVVNRFRLFANQSDFEAHVAAYRDASDKSVLEIERKLAVASGGDGWARRIQRLCLDPTGATVSRRCVRDGQEEDYINPTSLRVSLTVALPPEFADASCAWQIGQAKPAPPRKCSERIVERVPVGTATQVSVVATNAANAKTSAATTVNPRDVLIVGMGDSIASGEGNPTEPVVLAHNGFCFRRPWTRGGERHEFWLPSRAKADVARDCEQPDEHLDQRDAWDRGAARWMHRPCHRSLYSYQARVALALAVENRQISVTLVPLGCTGATILTGMLGQQEARERPKTNGQPAPKFVPGQINELQRILGISKANAKPRRRPDLVLLTIGANDVGFAGMVANIVIQQDPERSIAKRALVDPAIARVRMKQLPQSFRALRQSLLTITGNDLSRVLFSTYPNPGLYDGGKSCPSTRRGFDAHPAFAIDGSRLDTAVRFVDKELIPALRDLATCAGGACTNAERDRMTYVDDFRTAFANHGFCAAADNDPAFDRDCFRNGASFRGNPWGAEDPLACDRSPGSFRAYAPRARWFRTVNDSYFTAMTYPSQSAFLTPTNIHDATWGVLSVFYGGAMHPTAEGHAAIADGNLPAARKLLGLPAR
jgi:hypothetical protein